MQFCPAQMRQMRVLMCALAMVRTGGCRANTSRIIRKGLSTAVPRTVAAAYRETLESRGGVESAPQLEVVRELDRLVLRVARFARARRAASGKLGGDGDAAAASVTTSKTMLGGGSTSDAGDASPPSSEDGLLEPFPDVRAVGSVPRGLYIWGPVGTGKTMLMDLLPGALEGAAAGGGGGAAGAPAPQQHHAHGAPIPVRRVHFHAFMLETHARIRAWKLAALASRGRDLHIDTRPERDAIAQVARDMAKEAWVLCFDEFQVTDIADALILSRMFRVMWANGVTIVATSNRPPEDLYQNGLNRHYFLPFIDALKVHARVAHLDAGTDYRTQGAVMAKGRFVFEGSAGGGGLLVEAANAMAAAAAAAAASSSAAAAGGGGVSAPPALLSSVADIEALPRFSLPVAMSRTISVRFLAPRVAVASFAELCAAPVAAADFLALSSAADALLLTDVPVLRRHRHNEARRFITLVDALYEAGTAVIVSSGEARDLPSLFTHLAPPPVKKARRTSGDDGSGAAHAVPKPQAQDSATESSGTAYADPAATQDAPFELEVEMEVEEDETEMLLGEGAGGGGGGPGPLPDSPTPTSVDTSPHSLPRYRRGATSVVSSAAELAALGELTFACRRALSRLTEMTSEGAARKAGRG